jgi:hypothetical protein
MARTLSRLLRQQKNKKKKPEKVFVGGTFAFLCAILCNFMCNFASEDNSPQGVATILQGLTTTQKMEKTSGDCVRNVGSGIGWYPPRKGQSSDGDSSSDVNNGGNSSSVPPPPPPVPPVPYVPHPCWERDLKYTNTLWWSANIKKECKEGCRHHHVHGVEVRDLGKDHFLGGEKGLFATEKFSR